MISVVIPLYNKAGSIASTLESVLKQNYTDYEIIVVDDGSTDGSLECVERLNIPGLRLFSKPNSGVSAARNYGIERAAGEYVAFLDADDLWHPEYLERQAELIASFPTAAVFASNYEFRKPDGTTSLPIVNGLGFNSSDGLMTNYFEVASRSHPPLWTSAVVVRKSALLEVGGFPVGVRSGEDLLTWARLAARVGIAYSRRPLAVFNVEGYAVSEKPKRVPADDDVVGRELLQIKRDFAPKGISKYISHWHKMRSSVYMRLGMRRQSIREALVGLRHSPANYKLLAFIALNLLPGKLRPF